MSLLNCNVDCVLKENVNVFLYMGIFLIESIGKV